MDLWISVWAENFPLKPLNMNNIELVEVQCMYTVQTWTEVGTVLILEKLQVVHFREEGFSNPRQRVNASCCFRKRAMNSESVTGTKSGNPTWSGACFLKLMDLIAFFT